MRNTLIEKLICICKDYRHIKFDKDHVETWLNQFNNDDQEFLLEQLVNILEKTYISEKNIDTFVKSVAKKIKEIENGNWISWGILENNIGGDSQIELNNKLLEELSNEGIQCSIVTLENYNNDDYDRYIYIDDVVYTGNKFRNAFRDINYHARKKIDIFFVAIYTQGDKYLKRTEVNEFYKNRQCCFMINNILTENNYCILHPSRDILVDGEIGGRHYPISSDRLFSNSRDRYRFEKIFYFYGKNMIGQCENPAPNLKPLGYSIISYLGFGNMFIFYRNISNNSPLALWYGNTNEYLSGNFFGNVLGRFYPLFPRKTN